MDIDRDPKPVAREHCGQGARIFGHQTRKLAVRNLGGKFGLAPK